MASLDMFLFSAFLLYSSSTAFLFVLIFFPFFLRKAYLDICSCKIEPIRYFLSLQLPTEASPMSSFSLIQQHDLRVSLTPLLEFSNPNAPIFLLKSWLYLIILFSILVAAQPILNQFSWKTVFVPKVFPTRSFYF